MDFLWKTPGNYNYEFVDRQNIKLPSNISYKVSCKYDETLYRCNNAFLMLELQVRYINRAELS